MKTGRQFAALLVALAAAMLVAVSLQTPLSAQPPRPVNPPDIAGEWTLTNNEEDTTAQPPLGDYLGIPFNAAAGCVQTQPRNPSGAHRNISAVRIRRRINGAASAARGFSKNKTRLRAT